MLEPVLSVVLPLAILFGGPLGVLLHHAEQAACAAAPRARLLSAACSMAASVALLALIPWLGTCALALAAITWFARLVARSLHTVPPGLVEAAQAMGASPLQLVTRVLLPEARTALLRALSVLLIGLLGYCALAPSGS